MKALSSARAARAARRTAHRWLLALALAAGCSGSGGARDAGNDAGNDAGPKTEVGADTHADAAPKSDVANDVRADAVADARDGAADADARDAAADADANANTSPDSSSDVPRTLCPAVIPVVTVDSGTVSGVLTGASSNPATSCRGGVPTLGPEAFFTLIVTNQETVTLTVAAPVDTIVAIRPGTCSDTISELACGEQPPAVDADAGVPPPPPFDGGVARLSGVRAPLAPGTYTIVVDTYTLGTSLAAPFSMTIGHLAPAANASCDAPTLLTLGMTATAQPLDRAGAAKPVCGGAAQSSLYYTVGVPAGQRLTARATPRGGDRTWMPRLAAFNSCNSNTCIAQGHVVSGTTQQLDWVNNGSSWQLVYLAVDADGPVSGATFDLAVNAIDLFATCTRPTNVVDGTNLTNQDLSLAATPAGQTCTGGTQRAFYYAATLLPRQSITVQTRPSVGTTNFFLPIISIRTSCDTLSCLSTGSGSAFMNQTGNDLPILVEISSNQPTLVGTFDVSVSMPPPPAGVVVTPTSGLVTSESGGTATFTVTLASPPTADVTIDVASDTPSEGTASPASLTFTDANWRMPQTVTVTGVDDQVADGPRDYTIVTSPATSNDGRYSGFDPDDVACTNLDNEPSVSFVGAGDVVTSESGKAAQLTVVLNTAPTADVTMTLASNDVGEGTVTPAQVTFTSANWNMPQTVTVTGVDDAVVDGTQVYSIVTGTLSSTDARYGGQNPPDITARNLDDDQPAIASKIISADHVCSSTAAPFPIAVDAANQLYIVMQCEGSLWVTTSTDAGATFSEPTVIPDTDIFGGAAQLVGGAPGFAYLLFVGNDGNVYFTRTADGGATWSSRVSISGRPDLNFIGAGEKTVVIATIAADGSNTMVLSRSVDGGRSFLPKTAADGQFSNVTVEPDGRTVWIARANNGNELLESTDAGATLQKKGDLPIDLNAPIVGHTKLFGFTSSLQIVSLADTSQVGSSIGFVGVPPLASAVDDVDSLSLLDNDAGGHLRATHVVLGQTPPSDGRSLGPGPNAAGIATLSRKAAAVAVQNGNLVLYQTVVW
jgi:hypothetical protein